MSVEFIFNGTSYKQINGIAMGNPFSPALANIYVGFYEQELMRRTINALCYHRYVDDMLCVFDSEEMLEAFSVLHNDLNQSLRFLCKKNREIVRLCHFLMY